MLKYILKRLGLAVLILLGVIAVLLVFALIRSLIRGKKTGKSSCCGSCAGCPMSGKCHEKGK